MPEILMSVFGDVPGTILQGCLLGGLSLFLCGLVFRQLKRGFSGEAGAEVLSSEEMASGGYRPRSLESPYAPPGGEMGGAVAIPPPLPVAGIRTEYFRPYDFLWAGVVFLLFSMQVFAAAGAEEGAAREVTAIGLVVVIALQVVLLVVTMGLMVMRVSVIRWLGLRWAQWRWVFLIGPGGVVLTWVAMLVLYWTGYTSWAMSFGEGEQEAVKLLKDGKDPLLLGLMAVGAVLVAPVCEEVVFRGYLYPLTKKYGGRWVAAFATSLVFAAAHGNLAALLPLFLLALFLVWLYEVTGSLWAPIAVHLCFNGATVLLTALARFYELPLNPPS